MPRFITRALILFEICRGGTLCPPQAQKLRKSPVEIGLSLHPKNDYGIFSYDLCMYKSPHKLLPTQTDYSTDVNSKLNAVRIRKSPIPPLCTHIPSGAAF